MIESISISKIATYTHPEVVLTELSKINFFYGANGSGKTTIGRVIAEPKKQGVCALSWSGDPAETLVYNRDFVEANFREANLLKGVFTLGSEQSDAIKRIEELEREIEEQRSRKESARINLEGENGNSGKKQEISSLDDLFRDQCWIVKRKFDEKLAPVFEGLRNNKERFRDRILQEVASNTSSTASSVDELAKKVETVFAKAAAPVQPVAALDAAQLCELEKSSILSKRILGKGDVDIAGMIHKLGNSDWVRAGLGYHEVNGNLCPFCQQPTTEEFAKSLREYFDESFEADSRAIALVTQRYEDEWNRYATGLDRLLASGHKYLDVEIIARLERARVQLGSILKVNAERLSAKKREPSQFVVLESASDIASEVASCVSKINAATAEHNKVLANLANEQAATHSAAWRFVLNELATEITSYQTARGALEKTVAGLTKSMVDCENRIISKRNEIKQLEQTITSVRPTVDAINGLLSQFGFRNFRLEVSSDDKFYRLVRSDGSQAMETLSEGEKSFVTFLYFYHLLKGSVTSSGIAKDRVVVFDDPVSSLDSDVLFIVSTLIKRVLEEVRSDSGRIKQVFVLTHNIYFHKEVTFTKPSERGNPNNVTFWIVRKPEGRSIVQKCERNPVRTSYELLWEEVRRPDRSNSTIQNTLRRILEHYFKILGGLDLDGLADQFDGEDKVLCRGLCSWVNEGSHYPQDDLYATIDGDTAEKYLVIFKKVFEKLNQTAHYNMMMEGLN